MVLTSPEGPALLCSPARVQSWRAEGKEEGTGKGPKGITSWHFLSFCFFFSEYVSFFFLMQKREL